MNYAIQTEGLTKHYRVGFFAKRLVRALNDLTFSVEEGQVMGLLGPNGAGKSTTIKLLLNLIRPTSGRTLVYGKPPSDTAARREVGFLPENPAPYEYLTGAEFVSLAGALGGLGGAVLRKRVGDVIAQVEMTRAAGLQIRKYSKGMIQRISLAQALVNEPRLLILDEPTSGLDVLGRQLVRDIILAERRKGTTVLFCSHIISDVEALCDRVSVLLGGKLVREGTMSELLSREKTTTEVSIEGVSEACASSLSSLGEAEAVANGLVVRCDDASVNNVLQAVLADGGRVISVNRTHYSLENLFLDALKQNASTSVGSTIA